MSSVSLDATKYLSLPLFWLKNLRACACSRGENLSEGQIEKWQSHSRSAKERGREQKASQEEAQLSGAAALSASPCQAAG